MESVAGRGAILQYYLQLLCNFGVFFLNRIVIININNKKYLVNESVLGQIYTPVYYPELTRRKSNNFTRK
jgi:hypothetical protein